LTSFDETKKRLNDVTTELDLRVLQQASIIGVTTSGLARNLDLLRGVDAKVLICEEAGEVLEAHMLTALLPSVEHCMLIGDHQQLRPQVQNFDLSSESRSGGQYALDVSLFERLVKPQDVCKASASIYIGGAEAHASVNLAARSRNAIPSSQG
jgi:superfamily I DNA and/or RNA helicase